MSLQAIPNGIPDACPSCLPLIPEVPYRTEPTGPSSVRCWYRCPACLWSWWTRWDTRGRDDEAFGGAA